MLTFDRDHTLPALPVPDLGDTCQALKRMIRPLVPEGAFEEASQALDALEKKQGAGPQALLLDLAASDAGNLSWLRPIWDDIYLSFRDMLPIHMNYTFRFVKGGWGKDGLPALLSALAGIIGRMRTESLPPEPAREGFLSMDTVAHTIYTRIPGRVRDILYHPPLSGPMAASVVCRGRWFILSLTDGQGGTLSPAAIGESLEKIHGLAWSADDSAPPVGAMTCAGREDAARLRELLQASPRNRMNLERIEKTVFTVCLDEPPREGENFSLRLIAGAPENRWFDKSLQIISDGKNAGVNIEHSGCDAGIWVYLLNQADALLKEGGTAQDSGKAHILPLTWDVPQAAADGLEQAGLRYRAAAGGLSLGSRRMAGLSKERIKSAKCSPDAFVQLLYQTAYHKLTGRFGSVYEAVSTRDFYQGRTECVRPVTGESTAFVRAFLGGGDEAKLRDKFRAAAQAHGEVVRRAQKALGPERHMTGLSMMARIHGLPLPDIFAAEGYKALRHDSLSTSSTTAPYIDFFAFGPVVEDGIGIGYGIKPDALHAAVCAYRVSSIRPERFLDEMEQAAEEFFQFLGE